MSYSLTPYLIDQAKKGARALTACWVAGALVGCGLKDDLILPEPDRPEAQTSIEPT